MKAFPIFIGYDPKEAVTYHVACQSILERATIPVAFIPLAHRNLSYTERHTDGSNAFIYSRFLVPSLCGFVGHALYLDSDVLVRADINDLLTLKRFGVGVQVVKHDYQTKHPVKYLGNKNEDYPRKNWSSVILWNCGYYPHRRLTPEFIAQQDGSFLHRFGWLDDSAIASLPRRWNHLTLEYEPCADAKLYHFTVGAPCFDGYQTQEGGEEWRKTLIRALAPL